MKYCLFDGGDVVGPFSAKELLLRPGFGAHSLVCPEEHSVEGDYWKEAHFYEEFGLTASAPEEPPSEDLSSAVSADLLEEMDHAVRELDSVHVEKKTSASVLHSPSAPQAGKQEPKQVPPPPMPDSASKTEIPSPEGAPAMKKTQEPVLAPNNHISSILFQASQEMKTKERKEQKNLGELELPAHVSGQAAEKINVSAQTAEKAPQPDPAPAMTEGLPVLEQEPSKEVPGATGEPEAVSRSVVGSSNPIEEYFNTIRSGDLGRILGIPDPNENSDLNLARALESQFEKTDPGTGKLMDGDDPFDDFLPTAKTEPLDEFFQTDGLSSDKKTEENLKRTLPDLQDAEALPLAGQPRPNFSAEQTAPEPEKDIEELVVPPQEDDPEDKTVQTILEGKLKVDTLRQEIAEPIKEVPAPTNDTPHPPAPLASSDQGQRHSAGRIRFLFLLLGVVLLLAGAGLNLSRGENTPLSGMEANVSDSSAAVPADGTVNMEESVPDARTAVNAAPVMEMDPLLLAQEIVQNYQLDNGRGTIEQYLNRLYSKQLQDGYAAAWSAEPLHRDSYVVKYRLAKTRQEPIVYIFQADTAKKKLTGALNNITLDLVGKIS